MSDLPNNQALVDFVYTPVINFSLQQNHVPVVKVLTVTNLSETDWEMASIEIKTEPGIVLPWKQHIPLLRKHEGHELGAIQLELDTQYLAELTEKITGRFTIIISVESELIYQQTFPVDVLAYDQWNGIAILPELLVSFVTPNHPEISKIIRKASFILEKWTGNPSFDEYQSKNPDRIKKQMAAIYEAIAEMKLIYCSAPASFEERGQRIRLADAIISNKLANCLDLSLLYSACLEAVGIHPFIIILKGHAFAGGWLVQQSFSDPINDDSSLLTKRIAEGINEIILVEATCMCAGNNVSFDEAFKFAFEKLGRVDDFILFIDVKRARFSVRPLPLRVRTSTGWEIEPEAKTERENSLPADIVATKDLLYADKVKVSKQQLWERKLLDLTLRNSLLNIRITKSVIQFITVNAALLEDALANGDEFQVLPRPLDWENSLRDAGIYHSIHSSDPIADLVRSELTQKRVRSYLSESELSSGLTNLFRSSRISLEENGANTLYVGLGLLKWYETTSSERARYAPILLVPVEIIRKTAQKGYIIRGREEETIINITLLEMIRHEFGIGIGGLESLPRDESGVDVKRIFTIIRQAIMSQSRWDVADQAILGLFSFSKFILWNDIHNNEAKLTKNKVVASLISGKLEWPAYEEVSLSEDLDKNISPAAMNLPISYDSSQLEAIVNASQGKSFVLHGPPGTGKSQTITNIIASALYAGKKVLFVAAKKAALEVVQDRLDAIGIGPFCLELHSNKSKKSAVLLQLKEAAQVSLKAAPESYAAEAERLSTVRNELNAYVTAVHCKYSFGFSLFDAFNRYGSPNEGKDSVSFPAISFSSLAQDAVTGWNDLAEEMQTIGLEIGHPKGHPLALINIPKYSNSIKEEAEQNIKNLLTQVDQIKQKASGIRDILKLKSVDLYRQQEEALMSIVSILLNLPDVPASLLLTDTIEQTLAQVIGIADHGIQRDLFHDQLIAEFRPDILTHPANQTLTDWNIANEKWFLSRWTAQQSIGKKLKRLTVSGKLDKQRIPEILKMVIDYQTEESLIQKADYLTALLGFLWQNGLCNWEQLKIICYSLIQINRAAAVIEGPAFVHAWRLRFAEEIMEGSEAFTSIHKTAFEEYKSRYQDITKPITVLENLLCINFKSSHFERGSWFVILEIEAHGWLTNIYALKDWYNWLIIKERLLQSGLQPLVDAYENGTIISREIVPQYKKGLYRSAAEYIIDNSPALTAFNGRLFEDKIKKFREISQQFEILTKEELYSKLAAKVPSFTQEAAQSSEIGILQKNIRNNGRAVSIRKIFDEIPNLLHRLTPCMLMSPISVAQYFDANSQRFDLVIFDEASQLPTCEAVSAIARARNVIVVGDPKQLPPTSFFTTNNTDDDNIEKEDLESILDDCLALSIPSQHLLWHYRSKHESLIAFSNAKYYENKLLTFPSIDDIISKVEFIPVKGSYDKGKTRQNKSEAQAIVEEVVHRLSDPILAIRSIGIVTFSSVQQTLIEDMLNDVFSIRPDLEKIALEAREPIFIKNLENVQGDERDVIFFSICYGPDEEGKVSLNFGPINREGGWRRLNVAVSRARYEMKIFSTLRSDQIDITRTASEGVAGLKAFLAYAEKGRSALPIRTRQQADPSPSFENILAGEIRKLGYEVHTQIGCSGYKIDLGIVHPDKPNEYILGLLCDGKNYYASKTARDREIVQVDVLKLLGWNIRRVWCTEWWEKSGKVMTDIMESLRLAKENITRPSEVSPLPELVSLNMAYTQSPEPNPLPEEMVMPENFSPTAIDSGIPYNVCNVEIVLPAEAADFLWLRHQDKIMNQINAVLDTESPISKSLLCKRVLTAWGIGRLGSRIEAYFETIFNKMDIYKTKQEESTIFWKGNTPNSFRVYRIAKNEIEKRSADDLPSDEVANAILEILTNQISLSKADLIKEAARLLGYARIGSNVETAMSLGIQRAVERGDAFIEGNRIVLQEKH